MFILCVLGAVLPPYYPVSVLLNLPNFVISTPRVSQTWICWEKCVAYFLFSFQIYVVNGLSSHPL